MRSLRDELLHSNQLRKQQLLELGQLREDEKQRMLHEHDEQVAPPFIAESPTLLLLSDDVFRCHHCRVVVFVGVNVVIVVVLPWFQFIFTIFVACCSYLYHCHVVIGIAAHF